MEFWESILDQLIREAAWKGKMRTRQESGMNKFVECVVFNQILTNCGQYLPIGKGGLHLSLFDAWPLLAVLFLRVG